MSLSQQAVGGVLWAGVEKIGSKAINFITTIFLARILLPEDFGIVAMIAIFFAVSMILVDSGFSQALIREDEISENDKATTFYINLLTALILFGLLWFLAPLISQFFEEAILIDLTRFMAFIPIFFSLSIIQRAYYSHKINFRTQAKISLIAALISGIAAITMAFWGYGVWAIAAQQVSMALITTILFWIVNPWIPKGFINKDSFKRLFGFGSNLMAASLINVFFNEIYKVIIGRMYNSQLLGFYAQAEIVKNVVSKNLIDVMVRVTYPALSKIKDDLVRLKDGYRKIIQVISIIIFPAMAGLILVAEPMIITIIGEKWRDTIPVLQVLALMGFIHHLHVINLNVLKVIGRSDLLLKITIIKKVGAVIAIIIGITYGFWGLIIAQVVSSYLSLIVNMYYTAKLISYSKWEQLKDVVPIFFYSVPMILVVFGMDQLTFEVEYFRLTVLVITGLLTYASTCLVIKPKPFRELIYILRPKLPFLNKLKV